MVRKLAAVFLLSLLIVAFMATSVTFGADKPLKSLKDRAAIPARFAPVYSFPGLTGSEYTAPPAPPQKAILRTDKAGEGIIETIGSTTYDYQHNCTMGRQVEHRVGYSNPYTPYGLYIHFDWMKQLTNVLGVGRGVGYQAYDITACGQVFDAGGIDANAAYAGYVTMDAHNIDPDNSWGIPSAHQDPEAYAPVTFWDFQPGGSVFGVFTSDHPTDVFGWWMSSGTDEGNQNIWPKIDWDIDGAEQIVHMVATESGGAAGDPQTFSYYRRVGGYGTGVGVWSAQRLIDTSMNINVMVTSSPVSDKVAIVWNAPVDFKRDLTTEFESQYNNDIWFAIATDNGAAWENDPAVLGGEGPSIGHTVDLGIGGGYNANGGNLTTYAPEDNYKAYCDISALWYIDALEDDYLQILWGCRYWPDAETLYRRSGALYHWNQKTDIIRTVVKADWDTGGACYGHAWGTDVAKISISQCDGKLYALFTQFGDRTHPCAWYDASTNIVSGYIYMTVFDPSYDAWDRPQRVTSILENQTNCTPGTMTGPGTCNSEYWASMVRYGRLDTCKVDPANDVLDIVYVNDYWPGGVVQPAEGEWTVNPVNWVVYPCRDAVPEPGYSDNAGPGYGLCVGQPILVIGTTHDTTFTLTLENFGILDNDFTIVATIDSSNGASNGANTTLGLSDYSGTIPGRGGEFPISVTLTTTGEDDYSTVYGTIRITHEAEGSPRVIPVCLMVVDGFSPLQYATLSTTCKRLRVYNNGQMANNTSNEAMDFTTDPDDCGNIYLYDGSPIICRDDNGTSRCYFATYDNSFASDHALRQVSPLFYDNVSNADYEYATAEFLTGDSAVGLIVEYFSPKAALDCGFIVQKLKYWNRTGSTLSGVAVGEVLDWDIPSYDHGSNNESDYDATRELIYMYCGCPSFNDPCDSTAQCDRYGGIAAYAGNPFKNYMTLENEIYVYSSGPFGNEAPLPDDTIYGLMTGVDGFSTAVLDSCSDLMTLVTFDVYDLAPGDTMCVVKIITSSKDDNSSGDDLKANVDRANLFVAAHEEIECGAPPVVCDCRPGDANGDGQVNVGDAVYIIGYVFKGGAAPTPYQRCSGDANGDCQCNVGDAVYIIGYVFKGGAAPVTCDAWVTACGLPIGK